MTKEFRKKYNITQQELANMLMIPSGRTVRRWENEFKAPSTIIVALSWFEGLPSQNKNIIIQMAKKRKK